MQEGELGTGTNAHSAPRAAGILERHSEIATGVPAEAETLPASPELPEVPALQRWCRRQLGTFHRKYRPLLVAIAAVEWLSFGGVALFALLINKDATMMGSPVFSAAFIVLLTVMMVMLYLALPLSVPAALCVLTAQMRSMSPGSEFALALSGEEIYSTLLREGRRSALGWPLLIILPAILSVTVWHISALSAFSVDLPPLSVLLSAPLLTLFVALAATLCAFEWQTCMTLRFAPLVKNRIMLILPALMGLLGLFSLYQHAIYSYVVPLSVQEPLWYQGGQAPKFSLLALLGTCAGMAGGALLWKRAAASLKQGGWILLGALSVTGLLFSGLPLQVNPYISQLAAAPLAALRALLPGAVSFGWGLPFLTWDNPYDADLVSADQVTGLADCGLAIVPGLFADWSSGILAVVLYFLFGYWVMRSANKRVPEGYRGVWEE